MLRGRLIPKYAIFVPSGDTVGAMSAEFAVVTRVSAPVARFPL